MIDTEQIEGSEETIRVLEQFLLRIKHRVPQPEKEKGTDPDVEIFCNQQERRAQDQTLKETLRAGILRATHILRSVFSQ